MSHIATITVRRWTPSELARGIGRAGIVDEGRDLLPRDQTFTVRVPRSYLGGIVTNHNEQEDR